MAERQGQMNNQLSPTPWQTLFKKGLVWGCWLFVLVVAETSFFSLFRPFGAVPDLVLPAVIAIGIYDRERMGAIAGLVGGYLADALGGVGLSLSPLVYMLCGCFFALLAYSVLRRDFISWLVAVSVSLTVSGAASVICAYASVTNAHFGVEDLFLRLLFPQFFSSVICGVGVYFLTKAIWNRFFNNREMEG